MEPELVYFDGVLVRDDVLGGSNGSLYQRWVIGGSMYDPIIHDLIARQLTIILYTSMISYSNVWLIIAMP